MIRQNFITEVHCRPSLKFFMGCLWLFCMRDTEGFSIQINGISRALSYYYYGNNNYANNTATDDIYGDDDAVDDDYFYYTGNGTMDYNYDYNYTNFGNATDDFFDDDDTADDDDSSSNSSSHRSKRRRHRRKKKYSHMSDVWLCLACALGWTVWMVSVRNANPEMEAFQRDSKKVLGHVLQVSIGEDADGTGIPTYHAIIDYVVETEIDNVQIRKYFQSRRLLQEGFANVELLVLTEDPTISVLLHDHLEKVEEKQKEQQDTWERCFLSVTALVLIAVAIAGAVHATMRLHTRDKLWGWISVMAGTILLLPLAFVIYNSMTLCCRQLGPLSDRPGKIIHGSGKFACHRHCNSMVDPFEIFEQEILASDGGRKENLYDRSLLDNDDDDIRTRRRNNRSNQPQPPRDNSHFINLPTIQQSSSVSSISHHSGDENTS